MKIAIALLTGAGVACFAATWNVDRFLGPTNADVAALVLVCAGGVLELAAVALLIVWGVSWIFGRSP